MRLPRSTVLSLLGCLMVFSVILRYPETPHEIGVDSFFIHNLATAIVKDGNAYWILNPLSTIGWYPMSYPSGGPFLVAVIADLTAQPVETAILLMSLLLGSLGVPLAFMMAREVRQDDLLCIAVAFSYSYAPRFLSFTLWSASMRSLFMLLLPILIWSVLRAYRTQRVVNFALVALIYFLLAVTHRLAVLMALVLIAFLGAFILEVALKTLRIRFPQVVLSRRFRTGVPYLGLTAFAGLAMALIFGTDVLQQYATGELFSGTNYPEELLNFGVSLLRGVGLGLVFSVVGVIVMARSRNKGLREPFLLLSIIALTPTLFLRIYTGFYILPFIAILAGFALSGLSQMQRKRLRHVAVAGFFACSIVFSVAVLQYEKSQSTWMPMTTYSTALYVTPCRQGTTLLANDGLVGIRVAAVSGCSYLPVGGAGTTFQSPELLAYRYFSAREIESNTSRVPLREISLDSDSPWFASSIQAEADWVAIMNSPFNSTSPATIRYAPTYYLENKYHPSSYFAFGNVYPSVFASSAYQGAYKIYDADGEALWYVWTVH